MATLNTSLALYNDRYGVKSTITCRLIAEITANDRSKWNNGINNENK